ncbi:MAG: transglutaminase-like domain-containing protein [Rickettsiales bacterium]|jgi:hypothetical protein|nr:transglutaminase-like domain-containing protein [Rickettsiales bacterium]
MLKKIFLVIAFTLSSAGLCYADLITTNWKQNHVFNDRGQEVLTILDLEAKDLVENYYYSSWSYIFDKESNIELLEAKISNNNKSNQITFEDNKLTFNFGKLFNGERISLIFKYQEVNKELETLKYIRQEAVNIPKWVEGNTVVRVEIPKELDVYSLNENFTRRDNIYVWSGKIDKNKGFFDVFQMTKKKARWEVTTRVQFTNDFILKDVVGKIPLNYVGGNNDIIEYTVYNSQVNHIDNDKIKKEENFIVANFENLNSTSGFIEIRSTLENNYNNFFWLNNSDLNAILEIDRQNEPFLRTLANGILEEDKTDFPTYIKIGRWVNKNIEYDPSYYGKSLNSMEILEKKRGVCEHYAILYQDLLRVIGLPAQTVSGISYNYEKKSFENHAWVIVNHNSNWLPMDPTWNIFSGKLPISHIFMFSYLKTPYAFSTTSNLQNFKIEISNNAEFIE